MLKSHIFHLICLPLSIQAQPLGGRLDVENPTLTDEQTVLTTMTILSYGSGFIPTIYTTTKTTTIPRAEATTTAGDASSSATAILAGTTNSSVSINQTRAAAPSTTSSRASGDTLSRDEGLLALGVMVAAGIGMLV